MSFFLTAPETKALAASLKTMTRSRSRFFSASQWHPTIMLRRSALVKGGFNYNPHFRYSQDFDLWSRMIRNHQFANLQIPLLRLREHPAKISRAKRTEQQRFTNEIRARQIRRILPEATEDEIDALASAGRGDLPSGRPELDRLETCLLRLIAGNSECKIYEPQQFTEAAAMLMSNTCRRMLQKGNSAGARYLRSPLRKLCPAQPLRPWLTFLALSGLAALGIARKS